MKHRQPAKPRNIHRLIIGSVMLLVSVLCVTIPFLLQARNQTTLTDEGDRHSLAAARLTSSQREQELTDATRYNTMLAASGQHVIGDNADPFNGNEPSYDKDYLNQLNLPTDGIMATITYPRLDINLPIRHGTTSDTLNDGAGHLYGTSLPVGGANTRAVISAHSGMADKPMFDRLHSWGSNAKKGDVFYITTMGKTLAYMVTDITVVNPDEVDKLKIVPHKDLVTLLTCTPYGVNNKRLLVTGERAAMPTPAPFLKDAPKGHTWWRIWGPLLAFWLAILTVIGFSVHRTLHPTRRRRYRRPSHEPKPDTQEFPRVGKEP